MRQYAAPRSLGYFRFYVVLAFIFLLLATVIGTLLPLWEARDLFMKVRRWARARLLLACDASVCAPLTCCPCARSSSRARPSRSSSRPASTAPGAAAPGARVWFSAGMLSVPGCLLLTVRAPRRRNPSAHNAAKPAGFTDSAHNNYAANGAADDDAKPVEP